MKAFTPIGLQGRETRVSNFNMGFDHLVFCSGLIKTPRIRWGIKIVHEERIDFMENIFYGKLNELSPEEYKKLQASKSTDKVVLICESGQTILMDTLAQLNQIAAKIEYVVFHSDVDLYFYLGMNYQLGNAVFLGNIKVPHQIQQIMETASGQKKRKPRKVREENKSENAENVAEAKVEQAKDNKTEVCMEQESKSELSESASEEKMDASSKEEDEIHWMTEHSRETFNRYCGIPDDVPNREEVINDIAHIIDRENSWKEILNQLQKKYPEEYVRVIQKNIDTLSVCFNGAAFKRKDI